MKISLKQNMRVICTAEAEFLLSEHEVFSISDEIQRKVLHALIAQAPFDPAFAPSLVSETLGYFSEIGILTEDDNAKPYQYDLTAAEPLRSIADLAQIYWHELDDQNCAGGTAMETAPRVVLTLMGVLATTLSEPIEKILALAGLQIVHVNVDAAGDVDLNEKLSQPQCSYDLWLVLTDDYLRPELHTIYKRASQSDQPWCLVKPVGTTFWLGPLFTSSPNPGHNARKCLTKSTCWPCFHQRFKKNHPLQSYLERRYNIVDHAPRQGALVSTLQTALSLLATEVIFWLHNGQSHLSNAIISYNSYNMRQDKHAFSGRAGCLECGSIEHDPHIRIQPSGLVPPKLKSRRKVFFTDGGHRTCTPEETFAKYKHLISPITGVVRGLEKFETETFGGDRNGPIHTYVGRHDYKTTCDCSGQVKPDTII